MLFQICCKPPKKFVHRNDYPERVKHCLYFKKKAVKIGAPKFWPSCHYSNQMTVIYYIYANIKRVPVRN